MIKIGITGQSGFIGSHLYNILRTKSGFESIEFEDSYFNDKKKLRNFVKDCDAIVHLAAMNRHEDENVIYETNIKLVKELIAAMEDEKVNPHIIFSSSIQENLNNLYGKSKQEGRILFEKWAKRNKAKFTALIIPNVFGPFGKPFYNSFIATFSYLLVNNKTPEIKTDNSVNLIYVGSLCEKIINEISTSDNKILSINVKPDFNLKVSQVLNNLIAYKNQYIKSGIIPELKNINEVNLFNTFTSYIDYESFFPIKLKKNTDERGSFVEVIKTGIGGQISFSTTKKGITRGNHYHTRKIERFAVIKGKAIIELRKIGSDKKIKFYLNGNNPSFVDMPIWYTHNITNIGNEELYTQFWINEWYNPDDPDTFYEEV
ncbi:MAG: NAD-dependent epimerase/dehydratase family protein [Bacteroidales bacterium]|nr:NAD-dependent epimerase/dehydratase family protein [Bacteroidales bacterium]